MTDDATLSDFATNRDPEESNDDSETTTDGDHAAADSDSVTELGDVGFSTYASGEYECHRCSKTSDRVWRDDDELVCPACKSW